MFNLINAVIFSGMMIFGFVASAENMFTSTEFSTQNGWIPSLHQPAKDAGALISFQNGTVSIKSPITPRQNPLFLQVIKTISLENEEKYLLSFKGETDKEGILKVIYCLSKPPFTSFSSVNIEMEPGVQEYKCILPIRNKDNKGIPCSIRLCVGGFKDASITISQISLEPIKPAMQ